MSHAVVTISAIALGLPTAFMWSNWRNPELPNWLRACDGIGALVCCGAAAALIAVGSGWIV